jgi:hypothetical protein
MVGFVTSPVVRFVAAATIGLFLVSPPGPARAQAAIGLEQEGDLYMGRAQFEAAMRYFKAAIQRDPRNERLWYKYTWALERYLRTPGRGGLGPVSGKLPGEPVEPETRPPGPNPDGSAQPAPPGGETTSAEGAEPQPDPSAEATPSPSPSSEPEPVKPSVLPGGDPPYRSPGDIIYLSRPITSGDTSAVEGVDDAGRPIVIKTPVYEISQIKFVMDMQGNLHVQGQVRNSSERDFRNPTVTVEIYDRLLAILGVRQIKLSNSVILYRDSTGEFDGPFPKFNTTLGAYKIYMLNP